MLRIVVSTIATLQLTFPPISLLLLSSREVACFSDMGKEALRLRLIIRGTVMATGGWIYLLWFAVSHSQSLLTSYGRPAAITGIQSYAYIGLCLNIQ